MRAECARAGAPYRLVLPGHPLAGRAGERLGRGPGASLEFMDFRDYQAGDDLRHIDWRSFARTDQLKVRLFREEVAPHLDIVADLSPSMAVTPRKEQALRDLLGAFAEWARRASGAARWLAAGGGRFDDADAVACDGPAAALPREPLRPRGLRVWLSDFLRPGDPGPAVRRLAAGAAHVYVVQLLDPWELEPAVEGPLTLVDCETDERLDLALFRPAVATYRERLRRLRAAVERATRAAGGTYACVRADGPARMFRNDLLAQGVIEPE